MCRAENKSKQCSASTMEYIIHYHSREFSGNFMLFKAIRDTEFSNKIVDMVKSKNLSPLER